jgi:hypothetical protein
MYRSGDLCARFERLFASPVAAIRACVRAVELPLLCIKGGEIG